jgi:hypothetical protein
MRFDYWILSIGATAGAIWMAAPATSPTLEANLVAPEAAAEKRSATVEVRVSGLQLIDPAEAKEQPRAGQGHLHYRVDDGPIIATTTTKLGFHELVPGPHEIRVELVGNDHRGLGPTRSLEVMIPDRQAGHGAHDLRSPPGP